MEKNAISCPGSDCPGVGAGPKSLEHERRFSAQGGTGGRLPKINTASMVKGDRQSNTAK